MGIRPTRQAVLAEEITHRQGRLDNQRAALARTTDPEQRETLKQGIHRNEGQISRASTELSDLLNS
jgi:hypothetical protein